MAQQQQAHPHRTLPGYNEAFNAKVVPTDLTGEQFIFANNITYTDSMDRVASQYIFVDSCMRNWDKEEPNSYTVRFNKELKWVHSIELVDGFVPSSGYMIHKHNNKFYFQETQQQVDNNTYYVVDVPHGNYEIDDLLNTLKTRMEDVANSGSKYTITSDGNNNRVSIKTDDGVGTGIFNLIFTDGEEIIGDTGFIETLQIDPATGKKVSVKKKAGETRNTYINNSIGRILGFKPINLTGSIMYTGQYIYTLRPYDFLAIFVENDKQDDFSLIDCANDNVQGSFAFVPLDQNTGIFDIASFRRNVVDNVLYKKTFNPPVNIQRLKITFRTCEGELYDFNGQNNNLLFEVKRVFDREVIDKLGQIK